MTIQTTKYTSHITFSAISCCVDVHNTVETFSVEGETIKQLNTSTTVSQYLRPGRSLTTDLDGNVVEIEIPEQDISGEDEFTQQMIRFYWDTYKGDLAI